MSDNPMDALAVLRENLNKVAQELGLEVAGFAAIPAEKGGPHMAQAMFILDPAKAFSNPEQRKIDEEFEMIARMDQVERDDEKIANAGEKLKKTLEDLVGKEGIGLDDDDSGTETLS